jgi:hypothetical protein
VFASSAVVSVCVVGRLLRSRWYVCWNASGACVRCEQVANTQVNSGEGGASSTHRTLRRLWPVLASRECVVSGLYAVSVR